MKLNDALAASPIGRADRIVGDVTLSVRHLRKQGTFVLTRMWVDNGVKRGRGYFHGENGCESLDLLGQLAPAQDCPEADITADDWIPQRYQGKLDWAESLLARALECLDGVRGDNAPAPELTAEIRAFFAGAPPPSA